MALTPEHEVDIRTGYTGPYLGTFAKGTGTDPLGRDWWTFTADTSSGFHYSSKAVGSLSSGTYFVCAIVKPATTGHVAMINTSSGPEPGLLMDGSGSPALLYGTGGYRYEGDFGGDPVYTIWLEISSWPVEGSEIYWQTFDPSSPYDPNYTGASEDFNIGTFWVETKGANTEPSSLGLENDEVVDEDLTLAESITSMITVDEAVSESLTLTEAIVPNATQQSPAGEVNIRGYGAIKGAAGQGIKMAGGQALIGSAGANVTNATWERGTGVDPFGREWWTLTATGSGALSHKAYADTGTLASDNYFIAALVTPNSSDGVLLSYTGGPRPGARLTGDGTLVTGVGGVRYEGFFDGRRVYTVWFEMSSWTGGNVYWENIDSGGNTIFQQAGESVDIGTYWTELKGANSEPADLGLDPEAPPGGTLTSFIGDNIHASDSYTASGGESIGTLNTDVWFPLIADQVLAEDVATVVNDGPYVSIIGSGNVTMTFTAYRADLTVADNEPLDLINGELVEIQGDLILISSPASTTDANGQITVVVSGAQIGNSIVRVSIGGIVGIASINIAAVPAPGVGVISAWSKPLTRP